MSSALPLGPQNLKYFLPGPPSKVIDPISHLIISINYNPTIVFIANKLCFGFHFQYFQYILLRILNTQIFSFHQDHQCINITTISKRLTCLPQGTCLINICWLNNFSEYIHLPFKVSNPLRNPTVCPMSHTLEWAFSSLILSPLRNMPPPFALPKYKQFLLRLKKNPINGNYQFLNKYYVPGTLKHNLIRSSQKLCKISIIHILAVKKLSQEVNCSNSHNLS